MRFFRAIIADPNQPGRIVKIQAVTLLGAKREARRLEPGLLPLGTVIEKFKSQYDSKGYCWGIPCERVGTGYYEPGYHLHKNSPHDRRARQYWPTLAAVRAELGPLRRL